MPPKKKPSGIALPISKQGAVRKIANRMKFQKTNGTYGSVAVGEAPIFPPSFPPYQVLPTSTPDRSFTEPDPQEVETAQEAAEGN